MNKDATMLKTMISVYKELLLIQDMKLDLDNTVSLI